MIKGVSLHNFMSYEGAYVPLTSGLNLVCGPNGAGKSSILLAISVVLGQTYTERGRRLRDLVRWGTEGARVSIHIDNATSSEMKPFPEIHTDTVTVTRIIKRNGEYQYLLQDRQVNKGDVTEVFKRLGLDPNNMLIIMHQLMVSKFASIPPDEKLRMLEEAVGFQSYRLDVVDAHRRLTTAIGEEEAVLSMLQSTKETHDYWRREYEQYLLKKKLEDRHAMLKQELLWAKIKRRGLSKLNLESRIASRTRSLENAERRSDEVSEHAKKHQAHLDELRHRKRELEKELAKLSREEAVHETNLEWTSSLLNKFQTFLSAEKNEVNAALGLAAADWKRFSQESEKLLLRTRERLPAITRKDDETSSHVDTILPKVIDSRVEVGILAFKRKILIEQLRDLEIQLKLLNEELDPLIAEAEKLGPRLDATRKMTDIMMDIGAVEEQMKPVAHLSPDVEEMYASYSNLYQELHGKARTVAENKKELMGELERRQIKWRSIVEAFLSKLDEHYSQILTEVGARGLIRLIPSKEIEKAGLEILVGFKGSEPTPLDSLTQSGGERSIALMAFLLALQRHILSPFRAIDEFDVHLDPHNRDFVTRLIVASSKYLGKDQYLAITPGQVRIPSENINVIVVQNVEGATAVKQLKKEA